MAFTNKAPTKQERRAAKQQLALGKFSAQSTKDQLNRALSNFGAADKAAEAAAAVQSERTSKQSAGDRFSQLKKLQSSTRGILGSAGNALQGSQARNLMGAIESRQDLDTGESLGTLTQNLGGIADSLLTTKNENENARRDAINNAAFALRGIQNNTAAALSNINPGLYKKPGKINYGAKSTAHRMSHVKTTKAQAAGYFLPSAGTAPVAPTATGSSYFDRLMNS